MTNMMLLAAALLAVVVGAVHSWLGERRLIGPLLAPEKRQGLLASSAFARQVLRFAWHLTSLAWWGFGAILAGIALSPVNAQGRIVAAVVGLTFLATGLVVLLSSRGRHFAWPIFLLIATLSFAPLL